MANKREIKKDVDFLVGEVISDCYTYLLIHGEKNRDKVIDIIGSVVEKRNELISRINNPDKSFNSKQIKSHYKAVNVDLLAALDESFNKLSALSAKK
ncbi:MAG: hypothetical protein AB9846_11195 [Tenuifilaceae bacterium]